MSLRHIEFLFQETFTGIRRNAFMSAAAVTTIALSLLLLGSLLLIMSNLDQMMQSLCSRFEMRVFLQLPLKEDQRNRLWKEISAFPGVTGCRLIRKEEAWPEFSRRLGGAIALDDLQGSNPLPDSFVVRIADLNETEAVANRIRAMPGVDEVIDTHVEAENMAALADLVRLAGTVGVGLLILIAAVIVGNTIRLTVHARRMEIGIMQLVGATSGCIRIPFILEGVFHGIFGALLALALLATGYDYLHAEVKQVVPFLELLPLTTDLIWTQGTMLLSTGIALGLGASFLAVRRYLRV